MTLLKNINTRQNRILFSIFYVLSHKVWDICTFLQSIKLMVVLRANDKAKYTVILLSALNEIRHVGMYLVNIYLFKVNNRNFRKRCEICSKLTITTSMTVWIASHCKKAGFNNFFSGDVKSLRMTFDHDIQWKMFSVLCKFFLIHMRSLMSMILYLSSMAKVGIDFVSPFLAN